MVKLRFPQEALLKVEDENMLFAVPRPRCDDTFFFMTDAHDLFVIVPKENVEKDKKGNFIATVQKPIKLWEANLLSYRYREEEFAPSHFCKNARRLRLKKTSKEDFLSSVSRIVQISFNSKPDGDIAIVSRDDVFFTNNRTGVFCEPHLGGRGMFAMLQGELVRSVNDECISVFVPQNSLFRTYRKDTGEIISCDKTYSTDLGGATISLKQTEK